MVQAEVTNTYSLDLSRVPLWSACTVTAPLSQRRLPPFHCTSLPSSTSLAETHVQDSAFPQFTRLPVTHGTLLARCTFSNYGPETCAKNQRETYVVRRLRNLRINSRLCVDPLGFSRLGISPRRPYASDRDGVIAQHYQRHFPTYWSERAGIYSHFSHALPPRMECETRKGCTDENFRCLVRTERELFYRQYVDRFFANQRPTFSCFRGFSCAYLTHKTQRNPPKYPISFPSTFSLSTRQDERSERR